MKKLIINADDLGADAGRNQGIFEAVRAGVVTSASILVNGPAFSPAVRNILERKFPTISLGVHVNLSEGKPISSGLRLLAGDDGSFRGKSATHELLRGIPVPELEEEIVREIRAQIFLFRDTGLHISHIDGHQHVHIFPAAWRAVVQAALEFNILWVRIPEEPVPAINGAKNKDVSDALRAEAKRFSDLARIARADMIGLPLRMTDSFRGLYGKGRLSAQELINLIEKLPEGTTELMVHPGQVAKPEAQSPYAAFSTADRKRELDALMHPSVSAALHNSGVTLTSFLEGYR